MIGEGEVVSPDGLATSPPRLISADDAPIVVTSGDDGFALGLVITLWSLLERAVAPVKIVVLDCGLSEDRRRRLEQTMTRHPRCAQWSVVAVAESAMEGVPYSERFPLGSWARLLLPRLLPDTPRVIYIDGDVLVRAPIQDLWDTRTDGAAVAAVQDYTVGDLRDGLPVTWTTTAAPPSTPYFNGGVMVVDLDAWRESAFVDRAISWSGTWARTIRYGDQDVLNALNATSRLELAPQWNVQAGPIHALRRTQRHPVLGGIAEARRRLERDAWIVHFVGRKPWQPEGLRMSTCSGRWHMESIATLYRAHFLTRAEARRLAQAWLLGFAYRVSRAATTRLGRRLARREKSEGK